MDLVKLLSSIIVPDNFMVTVQLEAQEDETNKMNVMNSLKKLIIFKKKFREYLKNIYLFFNFNELLNNKQLYEVLKLKNK